MTNTYRVYDDGEIRKVSTTELKGYASSLSGSYPNSIEEAKQVITNHCGDSLADSICFSYHEAREISKSLTEN